jgi:hypothetical protein
MTDGERVSLATSDVATNARSYPLPCDVDRSLGKNRNKHPEGSGGHLMDNKRNKNRQRVLKAGLITFNGAGINCLVRNISDTGAALEVENQIGIPPIFDLVIAADHFTQRCHVVWRKEKRIGIVFNSGPIS